MSEAAERPMRIEPATTWPFRQLDSSLGARVHRFLWATIGRTVLRFIFPEWYAMKSSWLRFFGASIGPGVCIRPGLTVHEPRNLTIGEGTWIAEHVKLLCLAQVTIGNNCRISQYTYLCTGSHAVSSRKMELGAKPIVIEDESWLAADVYVGPGVTISRGVVVGARSSVYKDLEPYAIYTGNPAKKLRDRPEFKLSDHTAADAATSDEHDEDEGTP